MRAGSKAQCINIFLDKKYKDNLDEILKLLHYFLI